ncbi:S8 family peptidase [Fictibacillus iocasae]|uniref:S8 family peptidase n=1 Tax=Fictibacillus iocasae TaxID=2715437 RepID=A0ABW2NV31_9BACL
MNEHRCLDPALLTILSKKNLLPEHLFNAVIVLKQSSSINDISQLCKLQKCDKPKDWLPHIQMFTGSFCKQTLFSIADHPDVLAISHDYEVRALLNIATPAVDATAVRVNFGLTGAGVTIAVVDTGVFPHPDLTQPTNRIINFKDFVNFRTTPYDDNGHGTHITGDAASNGQSSGGRYIGPAPQARIVGVKVLNRTGTGTLTQILNGINYVISVRTTFNIRIMNLSLGSIPTTSYLQDPIATACRRAWIRGIFVVTAAGDTGPSGTINTPGYDPLLITAGAINDQRTITRADDVPALYTSVKPTVDGGIKPDINVPGTSLVSLLAPNSFLAQSFPRNIVPPNYFILSGTSVASGLLSGMAAQVLQAYPNFTPDILKIRYIETSTYFANDVPGYAIQTKILRLQADIVRLGG